MSIRLHLLPLALVAVLLVPAAPAQPPAAAGPLRVCLVSADPQGRAVGAALAATLGADATVVAAVPEAGQTLSLASLRDADAAVFYRGPGPLGADDAMILREFLASGRGVVVLGAVREVWAAVPNFFADFLGAEPGELFAGGAPMSVINLLPHPIYAGVTRFETSQPMPGWRNLAADAQLFMEGTVGEAITPLAWVRRGPAGRICNLVPAGADLFGDAAYLRIVANAIRWASGRPIPQARAIVQRTFMPESYPGAFAITFPNGPGVCLDPVRGGINFIWDGDFVDLRPRWLTKQGEPARIFGPIFYREKALHPLRASGAAADPAWRFRGYRLTDAGPEFHYQIGGREVFETLAADADGAGLTRRFRVDAGPGALQLDLEPQPDADVTVTGLVRDGEHGVFASSTAGEFTIQIRRKPGAARP